jgi:peptide/nickel transport system substrate-binding protein
MKRIQASLFAAMALLAASVQPVLADKTFRVAVSASPQIKGNALAGGGVTANFIWPAFYDSLTRIRNDGSVEPWLATAWEAVSETEWHFTLRPGVRFANGEAFNAEAVKTTFDMLRTDAARGFMRQRDMAYYPRVEIIDDLTVAIHTNEPNAMTAAYVSAMTFAPPAYLREVGFQGLVDAPIGTGPFVVDRWAPDKITARVNPYAWTPPLVDSIEIYVVPDSTARLQALETGQVDAALAISTDQIPVLEASGHRAAARASHRVYIFVLQTQDLTSPLSDVRVRQALNYAINKDLITEVLLAGLVKPASQPALPLTDGFNEDLEPYPYDPDKARQLMRDAGYENGFTFSLEAVSGFLPNDTAILQQITSDLSQVGITLNVNVITYPTLLRTVIYGEFGGDAFPMDFFNTTGDALRPFLRTVNHACTGLRPWYCDETIQPVIDEARVTLDRDRRAALTRQVVRHYRNDASSLFLWPVLGLDGLHSRVTGWDPWLDILNYHLMDVDETG